ncbi:hypothetical protein [Agarilytica rhodophyticola]|nr:hypothetical protein [Agarilytica rhodophyticola]
MQPYSSASNSQILDGHANDYPARLRILHDDSLLPLPRCGH